MGIAKGLFPFFYLIKFPVLARNFTLLSLSAFVPFPGRTYGFIVTE